MEINNVRFIDHPLCTSVRERVEQSILLVFTLMALVWLAMD